MLDLSELEREELEEYCYKLIERVKKLQAKNEKYSWGYGQPDHIARGMQGIYG